MSRSNAVKAMPSLLWKRWRSVVRKSPDAIALIEAETGKAWTRSQLDAEADALAINELAAAAGRYVAFSSPNNANWIALFLALQRVGAAAVPLDPALTAEQQDRVATSVNAMFVWRHSGLWRTTGKATKTGEISVGKITSGSTGAPRLIRCTADHLIADGTNILGSMKIKARDRNLAVIPLGHSYGLGNLVAPLLLQGTSLVTAESFVPRQLPLWIRKHRATVFPAVPAILRVLTALPGKQRLGPLRLVISAAARLSLETMAAFSRRFGVCIHNFYGSSETGGISFQRRGSPFRETVGLPLAGVTVELAGNGQVRARGKAVAAGRNGTYQLKDLGQFTDRGELVILGRAGRIANVGGRNLHPREIEAKLLQIAGVSDAWVEVISIRERDYLGAAVESQRSQQEIVSDFERVVPSWQRPRFWLVRSPLPRTPRGKLDATAIRSHISAGATARRIEPA